MSIKTIAVAVTTTGSSGSATGSTTSGYLEGFLLDVRLVYNASAPATTDVTISQAAYYDNDGASIPGFGTILTVSNSNTDKTYAVRQETFDATGASLGYNDLYPLAGPVTVDVAGSDALTDCVTAYFRVMTAD